MRLVICVSFLMLVAMATGAPVDTDQQKPIYKLEDAPALFEQFIKDYNRNYKDAEDRKIHYEEFVKSLERINKLNSEPGQTATFGINNFADFTAAERKQMTGVLRP